MDAVSELRKRYPRRRVIVTGAAGGLGLEICRRFAAGAWTIGMFDTDRESLYASQADIRDRGGTVHATVVDVADEAAFRAAFQAFVRATEGIDVMINNAGVAVAGRMESIPAADWSWALGVNLMGVVHGCSLALPAFRDAGKGLILNVASAAAFVSSPDMSAYNASKAAVVSLSETLCGEVRGTRIQVSVAMPAFFKTNLLQRTRAPEGERESARLLMEHSNYSAQQAAIDILNGAAAGRLYIFAPSRLKLLWYFKRLSPMRYLRWFAPAREKRLEALRALEK
jgi:NAD(P)-dependent dehydrogenase (short-subunit alcohol dehydrogenase family)